LLLGVFACPPLACGSPSERELSGVVLIVIDTLRSDRLSAYGNERSTGPVFDRLARLSLGGSTTFGADIDLDATRR
jgi:hypothetical protein